MVNTEEPSVAHTRTRSIDMLHRASLNLLFLSDLPTYPFRFQPRSSTGNSKAGWAA